MKNIFYLLAFTAFISGCGGSAAVSNGDKVDLDKYTFAASYRDLPKNGLDTSYHTYSVKIEYGLLNKLALRRDELENQVRIEGWRRLSYNAHVQVALRFEDLIIQGSEVKEKVEVTKDKDGKETGKKTYYVVEVPYSFGAQARITDYRGRFIESIELANRDQRRVHTSETFPSEAEAKAYSKYGLLLLTPQLMRQSVNNVLTNLSSTLTYNYGYPERTVSDFFWVIASRKHPEYENHRRAWGDFKQAITQMSPDEPLDEVRAMMKPVIDYYNKVLKTYSSDSKGDKKVRYASHYNLAKIYWYLDDPDAAIKEATELIINGYDAKDGNRLEAGATDLKTLMRQARIYSRHFRVQVEEYQGPDVASGSN
jgi:hypothetical protein